VSEEIVLDGESLLPGLKALNEGGQVAVFRLGDPAHANGNTSHGLTLKVNDPADNWNVVLGELERQVAGRLALADRLDGRAVPFGHRDHEHVIPRIIDDVTGESHIRFGDIEAEPAL